MGGHWNERDPCLKYSSVWRGYVSMQVTTSPALSVLICRMWLTVGICLLELGGRPKDLSRNLAGSTR